ncbi:MAG: type II toxin-antitoxin system RelB/DinJ family antitoxin [Clostridia bacterium]|nr:type II toxin-antitoxin system RelB/DinJ family antitoxin [Clostridia bacterium]
MSKISTNISLDPTLKKEGQELFSDLGLDLTTAVTLFIKQSLRVQGLPFPVVRDKPNAEEIEMMNEVQDIKAHPENYKQYTSGKELISEILADVESDSDD